MDINSKKLESTRRLVNYTVSAILCIFLILLSNKIIDDLDTATARPEPEHFENKAVIARLEQENKLHDAENEVLNDKVNSINKTIATAKENYTAEKQSFDNWIQTRKTLGSPNSDPEVIARAQKLDESYKVEQEWRSQLSARTDEIDRHSRAIEKNTLLIENERNLANEKYDKELRSYDLKVFLIRLLFVGPVLGIGIYFFIRYRKDKYWPLYFGFTLFSMYAFFFGLVPYLPSYGGYIRYGAGIALSVGLGYYAIKSIRQYTERKQEELKKSMQVRAKNVIAEVAEKALDNHYCPSCGKDFFIKKWEFPLKATDNEIYKFVTDFCRHCGLELFKNCSQCGNKNFAHLPYCSSCGTRQAGVKAEADGDNHGKLALPDL
ncbi:MAG: zinc finger Ran-binding domain-containing protein [Bacteroidota bacterium]